MKVKIVYLKLLIFLFTGTTLLAQNSKVKISGCFPVVAGNPSLYISYEGKKGAGKQKPDENKVLLRLHNNTNCNIEIITTATYTTVIKADGSITTDMPQDSEVEIGFRIENQSPSGATTFEGLDHDISISDLPPGQSVLFSVPFVYFKPKQVVYVPYKYNWEVGSPDTGTIVHRIYFENSKLPNKLSF